MSKKEEKKTYLKTKFLFIFILHAHLYHSDLTVSLVGLSILLHLLKIISAGLTQITSRIVNIHTEQSFNAETPILLGK